MGIDLERSRPGCPQDNGAHERLHLDISRQIERAGYTERQAAFDLWRKEFNEDRPREALGMRFPSEVYRDSERKYEGAPEKLLYPGIESRRVKPNGMIHFEGKVYFLSTALDGWDVGLAPHGRGPLGSPIRTSRSRPPGNSHRGFPAYRGAYKPRGSQSRMRPLPAGGTRLAQAPL